VSPFTPNLQHMHHHSSHIAVLYCIITRRSTVLHHHSSSQEVRSSVCCNTVIQNWHSTGNRHRTDTEASLFSLRNCEWKHSDVVWPCLFVVGASGVAAPHKIKIVVLLSSSSCLPTTIILNQVLVNNGQSRS